VTGSHYIAWAGLKLSSSCLCLLSAGFTDVYHYVWAYKKETDPQEAQEIYLRPHSQSVVDLGLETLRTECWLLLSSQAHWTHKDAPAWVPRLRHQA
jgi:hypothetical protein